MATLVYQYGLRPPSSQAEKVFEQLRLAHRYYNELLSLARARRAVERSLVDGVDTAALTKAEARLGNALAACREAKIKSGKRAAPAALRKMATSARGAVKLERRRIREARKEARTAARKQRDAIAERWRDMRRSLRRHYSQALGLRHGTYTEVESSLEQACSDTPLWDASGEPQDPRWKRWDGTGQIGVQLQGGRAAAEVVDGADTFLQLHQLPFKPGKRGKARPADSWPRYALLRLRIGSNEDRLPIWAEFPAKLHRPLPDGARIKRAMVSRRKEGPRECWTCELTIDVPEPDEADGEAVAIDIGWRREGDGLRVAAYRDQVGDHGCLRLDAHTIAGLRKPQELRAIRDRNLNEMQPLLCQWLREQESLPDWFSRATAGRRSQDRHGKPDPQQQPGAEIGTSSDAGHEGSSAPRDREKGASSSKQIAANVARWRSQKRFAKLARRWANSRWPGDEVGYDLLEAWRRRDHHLWAYEAGQRAGSLRHRRELYRVWAATLCDIYGTIVLERFDKRSVARTPPHDEEQTEQQELAQSWRVIASTSELVRALKTAARSRGVKIVEVDPAWSTQDCPACGHPQQWDAAKSIKRRPPCPECGCDIDQDDGACQVLLGRWRESLSSDQAPASSRRQKKPGDVAREGETRWERARRLQAERDARTGAAHESPQKAAGS